MCQGKYPYFSIYATLNYVNIDKKKKQLNPKALGPDHADIEALRCAMNSNGGIRHITYSAIWAPVSFTKL